MRGSLLFVLAIAAGCGGGQADAAPPASQPAASPANQPAAGPASVPDPKVSTEIRRAAGAKATCGDGDVCGYFLQIVSPGSDAKDLTEKVLRIIKGKCGGHVVAYKDARNVMGAGTVLATADEKRACEKALGRAEDKDFPNHIVLRAIK